jgi:hypothetical protein
LTGVYNGDELPHELEDIIRQSVQRVIVDKVVLAKRDPAINTGSVQAFKPKLVEGTTIKLSILSCGEFNADFDGDSSICDITLKIGHNKKDYTTHISKLEYTKKPEQTLNKCLSFIQDNIPGALINNEVI